jgi:hypothetical protein
MSRNRNVLFCVYASSVIMVLALLSSLHAAAPALAGEDAPPGPQVFLPVVSSGASGQGNGQAPPTTTATATATATSPATATATATPTVTPTPPATIDGAFFVDTETRSSSADIEIDGKGGVHTAFYFRQEVNGKDTQSMIYLYCPGPIEACGGTDSGKWSGINAFYGVSDVQLELNPAGQPRILVRADSVVYSGGWDYIYVECDENCTDGNSWQGEIVASTSGTSSFDVTHMQLPQRYFALDPQGRPRFVFLNRNFSVEPDLYGGYYAWCDEECATPSNWQIGSVTEGWNTQFNDWEPLLYGALTFTKTGAPRLVAQLDPLVGEAGIYYFACDGGCDQVAGWERVLLAPRGQGAELSWDISLDADDRPRVAYYPAALPDNSGERLHYAYCDAGCLDPGAWTHLNLGLGVMDGQGPDIELDGQGRPRVAYALYNAGGLGVAWCNDNCGDVGAWQNRIVESRDDLYTAWPVAYPAHCDGGIWDGLTPTLVVDAGGAFRVAYDTTYHARCWYDDVDKIWEPQPIFHLIQRAVRIVYFK